MNNEELKKGIGRKIENIIDERDIKENTSTSFDSRKIYQVSKYTCEPTGQLLRPRILIGVAKAYKVNYDLALTCGAIVEIVHADTLALDDIMDKATKRRKKLATYKKFGLDRTLLSCFNLNPQIINAIDSLPLKHDVIREIRYEINNTQIILSRGQEYDTAQTSKAKTLDDFAKIFEYKTGSLIGASAVIGGIIGLASEKDKKHLRNYGVNLGISYQFFDDWKDKYCNEKEVGKSVGLDARKKTPFDKAKPEKVLEESLRYRQIAYKELGKIKGKTFDDLI